MQTVAPRVLSLVLVFAVLLLSGTAPAQAGEGDTFRPFVSYAYTHDDNLFRVPDTLAPLYAPQGKSDSYQTAGIGFLLDWRQSRQRVQANIGLNKTKFDKYTVLDYSGEDYNAHWDWELGNRLSGRLGGSYIKSLGNYQDFRLGVVSNTRTNQNAYLNANYRFHSKWQAGVRLSHHARDYSASALRTSNSESDTLVGGLYYLGGTLERIGIELSNIDGRFPDRTPSDNLAREYTERSIKAMATWTATGASRVKANLGYVRRDNEGIAGGDFSGFEGRLEGDWTPTGKLLVNAALYRELNNYEYLNSNQVVVTAGNLSAQWLLSHKLRIGPTLTYETRSYEGTTRDDDLWSAGLSATYQPWPGSSVGLTVLRSGRDSTVPGYEYKATVTQFNAGLVF